MSSNAQDPQPPYWDGAIIDASRIPARRDRNSPRRDTLSEVSGRNLSARQMLTGHLHPEDICGSLIVHLANRHSNSFLKNAIQILSIAMNLDSGDSNFVTHRIRASVKHYGPVSASRPTAVTAKKIPQTTTFVFQDSAQNSGRWIRIIIDKGHLTWHVLTPAQVTSFDLVRRLQALRQDPRSQPAQPSRGAQAGPLAQTSVLSTSVSGVSQQVSQMPAVQPPPAQYQPSAYQLPPYQPATYASAPATYAPAPATYASAYYGLAPAPHLPTAHLSAGHSAASYAPAPSTHQHFAPQGHPVRSSLLPPILPTQSTRARSANGTTMMPSPHMLPARTGPPSNGSRVNKRSYDATDEEDSGEASFGASRGKRRCIDSTLLIDPQLLGPPTASGQQYSLHGQPATSQLRPTASFVRPFAHSITHLPPPRRRDAPNAPTLKVNRSTKRSFQDFDENKSSDETETNVSKPKRTKAHVDTAFDDVSRSTTTEPLVQSPTHRSIAVAPELDSDVLEDEDQNVIYSYAEPSNGFEYDLPYFTEVPYHTQAGFERRSATPD